MVRSLSRRRIAALLTFGGAVAATPSSAQEPWPTGPVRIIGLGQPGSLSDVIGRIMAEALTRRLGQQFIVEHRPGAGGTIGVAYTAKSKPDGYTVVLVSAGPLGIGPSLYQNPGYDAAKDLVAVARLVELANIVVVPKSSPYRTLQELLQKAKAEPGRVSYGSGGAGTTMHLATVLLGMRRAMELMLTGDPITGIQAEAIGFANRSFPRAELDESVLAVAGRVAGVPSDLAQINKRSVHRAFDVWGARAAIRAGTELQALAGHTHTAAERRDGLLDRMKDENRG